MNPEAIKKLRKQMKLSQSRFAELLGVRLVTVNRWEKSWHNCRPSNMALLMLANLKKAWERKKREAKESAKVAPSI